METLTIEQAKHYIGCQVQYNGEKLFLNGVSYPDNSHNINFEAVSLIDEQGFCDYGINGWVNIKDIKLILHPISDLIKPIEHNGERFMPLHKMVKDLVEQIGRTKYHGFTAGDGTGIVYAISNEDWQLQYKDHVKMFRIHDFSLGRGKTKGSKGTEHYFNQYECLQKLFEWQIWIFDQSYFDEGIIIDINTFLK